MTDDARRVFDFEALDRNTAGDRELRLEVVRMFLEDCPVRLEAIRTAVRDGDLARLRSNAHALRGAAGFLSATFVVDATAQLEAIGREGRLGEAVAGLDKLDAAVAQLIPELRKIE
jgi:HPt (histidine-containing phosphotransfer) domain-containing protein